MFFDTRVRHPLENAFDQVICHQMILDIL